MSRDNDRVDKIKNDRFPPMLFLVYLGVLLLMSGIHTGLLVGMDTIGMDDRYQAIVPIIYWGLVAAGLTIFTRREIKKTYEEPMHELAEATRKVAEGDFSVYVPTIHTADKMDYLDVMLIDFNKMVEELGSIETLKTDFFSNVSHEFKTPLAVIYNNAQILQKDNGLSESQRECVNSILYSSRRLSNLIQNMLKLNKLEKQTIQPAPVVYDICSQLSECAIQFEDGWEKKEIEFDADMDDTAYIKADPELMELVWNNLISNALKFTPQGGCITLMQKCENDNVIVSVKDSGCGMTDEVISHIFDKFYQGDKSHSTNGNGLGLALVKRILELSEGRIEVKSVPGEGSTFTVILKKADEKEDRDE